MLKIDIEKRRKHSMKEIKVSVVVPVYNVDEFLDDTLSYITAQTLKDIEIICVDDGSTDNSCKIIESWMEKDSRIQLVKQENQYAGVARNNGLKKAHGKYVIFWGADDLFEEMALEVLYTQAEKENADICICEARKYDNAKDKYIPSNAYLKEEFLPEEKETFNKFDVPEHIFNEPGDFLVQKSITRRVNNENGNMRRNILKQKNKDLKEKNKELQADKKILQSDKKALQSENTKLQSENRKLHKEITDIKNTKAYKFGNKVMWLPRKIRGIFS